MTDEELIARARNASSQQERNASIESLFERHYSRVALWCLRWTGNSDDAKDLAQEVFIKVHRSLDSFHGGSKFTTWLYMICRNHCINATMASRPRECVELDEALAATLASSEAGPEDQFLARAKATEARELVDRHLDPTERQVMMLHYVEGWSLPMVTRALKLTNASGAKAHLVSAHRKLKTALERWKARRPRSS